MPPSTLQITTSLFFLSLFSRLSTFILNQLLLNITTPEIYGEASIKYDLIITTILFVAREGIRVTLLRVGNEIREEQVVNMSYIPLGVGIIVAVGMGLVDTGVVAGLFVGGAVLGMFIYIFSA